MSTAPTAKLTRRQFLKQAGAGAAAVAAVGLLPAEVLACCGEDEIPGGNTWSMLIDVTRCTGCDSCALACKAANNLPKADQVPVALDGDTFTFVDDRWVDTGRSEAETRHVKRQCMHCLDAACVSACPAGAMYRSAEGPVIYRAERCLGCRYCQLACPFEIPRFDWENGLTPVISKCWMCYARLQEGQQPACAAACPTGALRFGRRDQMLAQAHAQIASNPDRYVDHVFGEHEVGGTSMLYLADVSFDQLGFPKNLPGTAPPEETEKIMGKIPHVIFGVAALMSGTAFYTHRRAEVDHETEGEAESRPAERLERK